MAKNNLDAKHLAVLFGAVIVVGLLAGIIGSGVGNVLTGKVILKNNAAGTGTYLIRPEGTYADTWLPYSDGSVYLTSNGLKYGAGFVLRKWLGNGSRYQNLMTVDKNGNMAVSGNLKVNGSMSANNLFFQYDEGAPINKDIKIDNNGFQFIDPVQGGSFFSTSSNRIVSVQKVIVNPSSNYQRVTTSSLFDDSLHISAQTRYNNTDSYSVGAIYGVDGFILKSIDGGYFKCYVISTGSIQCSSVGALYPY